MARVRARYPEFPLQTNRHVKPGPVSVPWAVADKAWAGYSARYGRDQSVERLAQRGGFCWGEMDTYFPGWREATDEWVKLRKELAAEQAARVQAARELAEARETVARTSNDLNATIGGLTAELKLAQAERDDALKAAAEYSEHLDGYGTLVGPCPHGRDPWDRCDTCGELNAVQVALLLRDAEREGRERAETDKATLHKQAVHAAAELRHAYRIKADWNLVAHAIETLERATAPGR